MQLKIYFNNLLKRISKGSMDKLCKLMFKTYVIILIQPGKIRKVILAHCYKKRTLHI